jgi:hypothetical protein
MARKARSRSSRIRSSPRTDRPRTIRRSSPPAAERVADLSRLGRHGDGVDREVAAREVVVQRGAELDHRVATVGLSTSRGTW